MAKNACKRGWVSICIDLLDHPIVGASKRRKGGFTKMEAWVWLIMRAAYKSHTYTARGKRIQLERGQLPASRDFLAKEWGWGAQRVRTFLKQLQNDSMIEIVEAVAGAPSVLTICKYNVFQQPVDDCNQADNQVSNQAPTKPQPYITKETKIQKETPVVPFGGSKPQPPKSIQGPSTGSKRRKSSAAQIAMAAALNPQVGAAHEAAQWLPDGRIEVFNGFRAECLDLVGGTDRTLRLRLNDAAPFLKNREGLDLVLGVRQQLSRQENWKAERQQERQAAQPARPRSNNPSPEVMDTYAKARERDAKIWGTTAKRQEEPA